MKTPLDPHLIAKTNGSANPDQIHIAGKTRVTVIAPELIRVEFDPRGKFLDKATQAVWFRDCGRCDYAVRKQENHLVVKTEKASFYINPREKKIDFVQLAGFRIDADNKDNLKGTYRTLDRAMGPVALGRGIIGRNGAMLKKVGAPARPEIEELLAAGIPKKSTAMQAIGYKEFLAAMDGQCTIMQAAEDVKKASRHYAKRQLTWFRRNANMNWLARRGDGMDEIIQNARHLAYNFDK